MKRSLGSSKVRTELSSAANAVGELNSFVLEPLEFKSFVAWSEDDEVRPSIAAAPPSKKRS